MKGMEENGECDEHGQEQKHRHDEDTLLHEICHDKCIGMTL